jgi:hypothetical protein
MSEREVYEVLISRHSLAELRKGHVNVIMGVLARPRQIVGDKTSALATLTVVKIKTSSEGAP